MIHVTGVTCLVPAYTSSISRTWKHAGAFSYFAWSVTVSQPNPQPPLLSQRAAVILLLGVLTAAAATGLTVWAGGTPAAGLLAGGGAFAGGVLFFNAIIS